MTFSRELALSKKYNIKTTQKNRVKTHNYFPVQKN